MARVPSRHLRSLLLLLTLLVAAGLGCSVLGAVTNPGSFWAVNEPATMSVVLRRTKAAERTVEHVDRLLVATSVGPDDKWPEEIALKPEDGKSMLEEVGKRFPYDKMPFRIMAAEAWSRRLANTAAPKIGGKGAMKAKTDGKKDDKKDAKKDDKKDAKKDDKKSDKKDDKKDAKKDDKKDSKKDAKKDDKKGDKKDDKKDAKKDGKKDDKKDAKKDDKGEDKKDGSEEEEEEEAPVLPEDNLLASIDPELAKSYALIAQKRAAIAKLNVEAAEEEANRDKMTADADKKASEEKSRGIEEAITKAEGEVAPLEQSFLESARKNAKNAKQEDRERLGPALAAMRLAVREAESAAAAAALRYPLALPGLQSDVQSAVPDIVADIIEEQTGHRPEMSGLKPDIRMEGTDVELTLNGLSKSDMGKIQMGDLVSETTDRTQDYVKRVVTLLAILDDTSERLTFQGKVLDEILGGFADAGTKVPEAAKVEDFTPAGAPAPAK